MPVSMETDNVPDIKPTVIKIRVLCPQHKHIPFKRTSNSTDKKSSFKIVTGGRQSN